MGRKTTNEVWIIGASQGLGLAVARCYARQGRRVVGMARSAETGAGLFDAYRQVDVTQPEALEDVIAGLYAEGRRPGLIIYMAAMLYQGPIAGLPEDLLRREVDTNYLGFVRLCQAVVRRKPAGAEVNLVATASTLGYIGCPSLDTYSASKAALISFARSARRELGREGVTVQILSPPHMSDGGADLVGPQPFTNRWAAPRFAAAADRGAAETVLGFSNRMLITLSRLAPVLSHGVMHAIGADALSRGATRLG